MTRRQPPLDGARNWEGSPEARNAGNEVRMPCRGLYPLPSPRLTRRVRLTPTRLFLEERFDVRSRADPSSGPASPPGLALHCRRHQEQHPNGKHDFDQIFRRPSRRDDPPAGRCGGGAGGGRSVITGARILSTYSERILDDREVWLAGGRIAAVKPAGRASAGERQAGQGLRRRAAGSSRRGWSTRISTSNRAW